MSTKNLARTVIEGGRNRHSRFFRRHSNAVERTRSHGLERRLCSTADPESAYFPPREAAYRGFDDKLGPARRWLRSQVGRPWDKVRSDLFTRFDIRTTAGRHIVFDHLLAEVRPSPFGSHRYREFWISLHGILRYESFDRKSYARARRLQSLPEPESTLCAWLAGRRIVEQGARLYWLVPTTHGGFRQHQELADADARRFRALPRWFRERFEGAPPADGGAR
jgi:hypothetical protein